jgi:hypothetical protein
LSFASWESGLLFGTYGKQRELADRYLCNYNSDSRSVSNICQSRATRLL